MEPKLSEVLDALNRINDEIRVSHVEGPVLELITNGKQHRVKFCGRTLWESEAEIRLCYYTPEALKEETFEEALFRSAYEVSSCISNNHEGLSSTPHGILLNSRINS